MGEHTFDSESFGGHPSRVMDRVAGLRAETDRVRMKSLVALAELDLTKAYEYDGLTSSTAFLRHRCGLGTAEAKREVFLARALEYLPLAVKFFEEGRLSLRQVEVLAHGHNQHPDVFEAAEETLCEAVEGLSLSDTRRAVEYWSQTHSEPDRVEPVDPSLVYLSRSLDGRGRLDGDLSPESRHLWETALEAEMDVIVGSTPKDELPSRPELRAMAFDHIMVRHLDSPDTPKDHGNRPHGVVRVDWETLIGDRPGGISELGDGTIVPVDTVRRLLCDANICRLVTGPKGEILELGRSRRTISPAQYRALRERDRHCQMPGCLRPSHWCDGHHVDWWWASNGRTDLDRLILLCRLHHTSVHEGGWQIRGGPGEWIFIRPDGTTLPTNQANAPP